jgi:alkaline phosphatase D
MHYCKNIIVIFIILTYTQFSTGQKSLLQSGPMLGPVTLRDVTLWLQTKSEAKVHFTYQEKGIKALPMKTAVILTKPENAYIATVHLPNLKTGTTYEYRVFINNQPVGFEYPLQFTTQEHWQFRKDPKDFTFVAGSCFYVNDPDYDRPGKPYGGEFEILEHINKANPDLMVWLGDNIYLREGDYESRSGIYYRNTHTRSFKGLQPLLAKFPPLCHLG